MEYKGQAVEKEVEKEVEGEKKQSQQVLLVKYVLESHKKEVGIGFSKRNLRQYITFTDEVVVIQYNV